MPVGADTIRPHSTFRGSPGDGPTRPGRRFWCQKWRENHQGLRALDPGAHGGGELYGQGKNRAGIAARFLGGFVTGAAAPRVARIEITLQALGAAALYRLGPPGRRRCLASEKLWWLW